MKIVSPEDEELYQKLVQVSIARMDKFSSVENAEIAMEYRQDFPVKLAVGWRCSKCSQIFNEPQAAYDCFINHGCSWNIKSKCHPENSSKQ